jgi:hypothetical protein
MKKITQQMKTYLMDPMGTSRQMTSSTSPRGLAGHRKAKSRGGISISMTSPNKQFVHNTTTSHNRRLMSPNGHQNVAPKFENRNQFVQVKKKYKGPADPIRSKCATFDDGCSTGRLWPFVRELPTAGGRHSQPPAITTSAPTAAVTST